MFFDLDGVIIDSRAAIGSSIDDTLRAHGLPALGPSEIEPLVGPPIIDGFRSILHARGRTAAEAPTFVAAFRDVYARVAQSRTTLVPGIADAIESLAKSHHLAVATSKARYLAVPLLEGFGLARWFRAIVGPEADALEESKSQTLARAIVLASAGPCRTMIGDRRHDIAAGHANGCRTIGVTWGIGSRDELLQAGADSIVDRTSDLVAAIGI